jgi:hypothetical protein
MESAIARGNLLGTHPRVQDQRCFQRRHCRGTLSNTIKNNSCWSLSGVEHGTGGMPE